MAIMKLAGADTLGMVTDPAGVNDRRRRRERDRSSSRVSIAGPRRPGGLAITLAIHGALLLLVYQSQRKSAPRPDAMRDLIITKSVKFTKPREKFWLPRIVQPPEPTRPEPVLKLNENPLVTPRPSRRRHRRRRRRPSPRTEISKDMQRALKRAQALANAAKEEDEGAAEGTARPGLPTRTCRATNTRPPYTTPSSRTGTCPAAC